MLVEKSSESFESVELGAENCAKKHGGERRAFE